MIQISENQMKTFENQGFLQTKDFTIISDDVMKSAFNELSTSLSAKDFEIVKANRSHLTLKTITDKNGKQKKVWVNPNKKSGGGEKDSEDDKIMDVKDREEQIKNAFKFISPSESKPKSFKEALKRFSDLYADDVDISKMNDFRDGKTDKLEIEPYGATLVINAKTKTIHVKTDDNFDGEPIDEKMPINDSTWKKLNKIFEM